MKKVFLATTLGLAAFGTIFATRAWATDVSVGVEPSTSMDIKETVTGGPFAGTQTDSTDLVMWKFSLKKEVRKDWAVAFSFATGGGPGSISGDLNREDLDLTVNRVLWATGSEEEKLPAKVSAGIGYHITNFEFPDTTGAARAVHQRYEGFTIGVTGAKVLVSNDKGQLLGLAGFTWMPDLSGAKSYDTISGDGTVASVALTYQPSKSNLYYTLGYKVSNFNGSTTSARALANIPGATKFSFDEDYKGFWVSVGSPLK